MEAIAPSLLRFVSSNQDLDRCLARIKPIAKTANRFNHRRLGGVGFNFFADLANVDIHHPLIPHGGFIIIPDLTNQLGAAEGFAGIFR